MKKHVQFKNVLPIAALFVFRIMVSQDFCYSQEILSSKITGNKPDWSAPYAAGKFRSALVRSKLQCPDSKTALGIGTQLSGVSSYYFHLTDADKMEFFQEGDHRRTELRDMNEWKTSTTTGRTLSARIKIQAVSPDLKEVTVLQIHDAGKTPDKPLLRIAWIKNRKNVQNHVWAIRRMSIFSNKYEYTDLGSPGKEYFSVRISVINNNLTITYNKEMKVDNADLTYWSDLNNYFKAGVYLQSDGFAYIRFDELEMR